jgi:tRNA G18 (ribose-2'-O)-methylase SpoU
LPVDLMEACAVRVKIPMAGPTESLNAAVAASVALFYYSA